MPSPPAKMKISPILANKPLRSALTHTKARVSPKYPANDCKPPPNSLMDLPYPAPSKTPTSAPGAPRTMPEHHERARITEEHHGEGRSITQHHRTLAHRMVHPPPQRGP